jgi:hypothetical protein
MAKLEYNETIYYKDWQNNDKIYHARVIECKRTWAIIQVLTVEGGNKWEMWNVEIEDCKPTSDFNIVRPANGILGNMVQKKDKTLL